MLSVIMEIGGSYYVIIPDSILEDAGISGSVSVRSEGRRIILERDTDPPEETA
jgi:hypothetical protein